MSLSEPPRAVGVQNRGLEWPVWDRVVVAPAPSKSRVAAELAPAMATDDVASATAETTAQREKRRPAHGRRW